VFFLLTVRFTDSWRSPYQDVIAERRAVAYQGLRVICQGLLAANWRGSRPRPGDLLYEVRFCPQSNRLARQGFCSALGELHRRNVKRIMYSRSNL